MRKFIRNRGFTLPEVLVTVTVVAVLAAVVVPAVTKFASSGDAPSTAQDLNQVRTAVVAYVSDTRAFPTNFKDLIVAPTGVTGWRGPYTSAGIDAATTLTASFTTSGFALTLGPAITREVGGAHDGYVTTPVVLALGSTCAKLWEIDKALDGGPGSQAGADLGNLQWIDECTAALDEADAITTAVITLRLMAVGT